MIGLIYLGCRAVDEVEEHTIEALVAMVMKLSENTFKPLFLKLVSWYKLDAARLEARQLAFVHVVDSLAGALKNIFGMCPRLNTHRDRYRPNFC